MILWGAAIWLMSLSGVPEGAAEPAVAPYPQTIVRQQIIVRMPVGRRGARAPNAVEWKEGKRVECVPVKAIAGATLLGRNSVDLVLRDNSRIRAKLERSCPALDYYHGFYISPGADGKICADRDSIRSRVGGACEIDAFRALRAVRDD